MRNNLTLIVVFLTIAFSYGQSEVIKNKECKKIILKSDKTWEYVENPKIIDDSQMESEYSNRPYYLNDKVLVSFEKVKAKIDIKAGFPFLLSYAFSFLKRSNHKLVFRCVKGSSPKENFKKEFKIAT